jgi:hypothetical protein
MEKSEISNLNFAEFLGISRARGRALRFCHHKSAARR